MPIPALDQNGLLPPGIHDCTLAEIHHAFCWNPHRLGLFNKLQDFVSQAWQPLGIQADLWVDGSFTRKKDQPDDIDVVADVSHLDMAAAMPAFLLWINAAATKANYKVDFWIKHPAYVHDLTHFFQYTGLKAGAELNLDAKLLKGILRIT